MVVARRTEGYNANLIIAFFFFNFCTFLIILEKTGYKRPYQEDVYRIQDTGYRIQDTGYRIQDTGYRMQDTGYRIQDTGYRIQDTGYRIQDTGYRIQDTAVQQYSSTAPPILQNYHKPTSSLEDSRGAALASYAPKLGKKKLKKLKQAQRDKTKGKDWFNMPVSWINCCHLSAAELIKVEVVKLHDCVNFSRICANFRLLEAKLVEYALFL